MGKEGLTTTRSSILRAIDALKNNTFGKREKAVVSLSSPDISYIALDESLWEQKMFKFVHLHQGFLNNPSDHLVLGPFDVGIHNS